MWIVHVLLMCGFPLGSPVSSHIPITDPIAQIGFENYWKNKQEELLKLFFFLLTGN